MFPGTAEEYNALTVKCLADAGWNVELDGEGGFSAHFTPEQGDAFDAALRSCEAKLGEHPPVPRLTDAEIRALFDYQAHDLRDCLIGLGYTISEPPTVDEFVDSYYIHPWHPYTDLAPQLSDVTSERIVELERVNALCPQVPKR